MDSVFGLEIIEEIGSATKMCLNNAGFKSIKDLVIRGPIEIANATGIDMEKCSMLCNKARKILEDIFERCNGITPIITEAERKEHDRELLRFFVKAFKRTEISKLLPTLHIHALCHASVRWDKTRKLKGNDLFDFDHAATAVPYCDVFLTERPLQKLIEQKHLKINQDFDCKIISSISEAVEFLEKE